MTWHERPHDPAIKNGESDERDDIDVEGLRRALTEHYSQTKSVLVSYSDHALGLF
jgi:hypothetical protein